jgi:hypothetical protein
MSECLYVAVFFDKPAVNVATMGTKVVVGICFDHGNRCQFITRLEQWEHRWLLEHCCNNENKGHCCNVSTTGNDANVVPRGCNNGNKGHCCSTILKQPKPRSQQLPRINLQHYFVYRCWYNGNRAMDTTVAFDTTLFSPPRKRDELLAFFPSSGHQRSYVSADRTPLEQQCTPNESSKSTHPYSLVLIAFS